jgi:hypothetical protein
VKFRGEKRVKNIILRNRDIQRVLMGTPRSHKHMRTIIATDHGNNYIFQEATIANIVRAYITLKTHPSKNGIELIREDKVEGWKNGFASSQLIDSGKKSEDIVEEINSFGPSKIKTN